MSGNWSINSPTNRGPKSHLFRRRCNLTATLTAYTFGMKHDIHNRASTWKLQGVSYIASKCHELLSTNDLKLDRHFYPPSVISAFFSTARLRRLRSANRTQPNFAKQWTINRANDLSIKSWGRPSKKCGAKKLLCLFGCSTTSRLNGECLLNETCHKQSDKNNGKCNVYPT